MTLSPRQLRAIAILASGESIVGTARKIGCAESTMHKWLGHPEFDRELKRARYRIYEAAIAKAVGYSEELVEIFMGISRNGEDVSTRDRIAAGSKLLDIAAKSTLGELESRVRAIEEGNEPQNTPEAD